MKSDEGLESRDHIWLAPFGRKGCVVRGQGAVLMSGGNISYPAGLECLGNMSASQMAEHDGSGVCVTSSGNPPREQGRVAGNNRSFKAPPGMPASAASSTSSAASNPKPPMC